MSRHDGSNTFYVLCVICTVIVLILMYFYGLLDMFVVRHYNRFIGRNDRLQRQTLGVISYSVTTDSNISDSRNTTVSQIHKNISTRTGLQSFNIDSMNT